jgi:diguanylate cyclase (GGDEF)-like protein
VTLVSAFGGTMKAVKSEDAATGRHEAGAHAAPADGAQPAPPPTLTAVPSSSVLGIPESEFTPRVREAVHGLMAEVERLKKETDQDTLLPILNRRAFVREVTRFISLAARYGTASSLVYIDLNGFKGINDSYGHAAGDAILRHIADILLRQVRDTDVVARIGGDEFGIVLAHVNLQQAVRKAAALDRALRERPLVYNGHTLGLGFSFGSYELRAGESADSAIAQADAAMYAQKRSRDAS